MSELRAAAEKAIALEKAIATLGWPKNLSRSDIAALETLFQLAKAYLAEHPADDDESADIDWLIELGGQFSTDGTAIFFKTEGPEIVCCINQRSGEQYVGGLGLHWNYSGTSPNVSMSYGIEDNPTRGQVRRLLAALGVKP